MHIQDDLQVRWLKLRIKLKEQFDIKPNLDGILLLIGVQELGKGTRPFTKEEKQDLMHIAVCTVLAPGGFYALEKRDDEGWPHFRQLVPLPVMTLVEQENFMKDYILQYFKNQSFIE
jgi:hypothetical protein